MKEDKKGVNKKKRKKNKKKINSGTEKKEM